MPSAESAFLSSLSTYLAARPALAGAKVGVATPVDAAGLPAVVLSLDEVVRLHAGLGERASLVTDGALPVEVSIDLANPVLPEDPSFVLLSADRLSLVMPHGGWVKADATTGPISSQDLSVSVGGAPRTVVAGAPGPNEVRPDGAIGTLTFGAALPAAGNVDARYFLGQWERRVTPIAGVLMVDVRGIDAAAVLGASEAVLDAFEPGAVWPVGLRKLTLDRLGPIGPGDPLRGNSRGRALSLHFEYEHIVDRPDSSGGVIRRIPITTHLQSTRVEPATGAIVTTLDTEVDT
jgi:hypothetical protein